MWVWWCSDGARSNRLIVKSSKGSQWSVAIKMFLCTLDCNTDDLLQSAMLTMVTFHLVSDGYQSDQYSVTIKIFLCVLYHNADNLLQSEMSTCDFSYLEWWRSKRRVAREWCSDLINAHFIPHFENCDFPAGMMKSTPVMRQLMVRLFKALGDWGWSWLEGEGGRAD